MKNFDYITNPAKLLTPEIVQMVGSIHEHKGKQELFLEANIDELKTLLEVALIQSTGASNRIEGIFTSDKRLEELVSQKAEPRNRSEQEIAGYREVLATIHESYEWTLEQYEGQYRAAMYAAVKSANPNWKPGQKFDTSILDNVTRESVESTLVKNGNRLVRNSIDVSV